MGKNRIFTCRVHMDRNFNLWLNTQLGKSVRAAEMQVLTDIFTQSGFTNSLILGSAELYLTLNLTVSNLTAIIGSKELMYYLVSDSREQLFQFSKFAFAGKLEELPIESSCIDLVVLPHTLEMVPNPLLVLTEVYRVLRPEGQVIITGFNSWSIWGCCRLMHKLRAKHLQVDPWLNNFYSVNLLIKWLTLLGFKCNKIEYYYYNLPINNFNFHKRLSFLAKILKFLPLIPGNVYTLIASKNIVGLTTILDENLANILVDDRVI